ncbi:MAG: caspase family protein [Syntrophales bacterium]
MKKRYTIIFICLALLICLALPITAAEKRRVDVKPKNTSQSAEHRIALVIGNANYRVGALRNPANDARAIATALRELGFEVDEQINLSYQDMGRAVNRFGKAIRRDSVALFYYAGHGLQVQGSNYLVPVDMEIQDEGEVQFNTVNAGQVLAKMEEAKNPVNIVILDACRDNPYARGWKRTSLSRGLASMDAPVGSFVAYAAAPGKTADDGKGKNGLYTESLVRQIKIPGMKIEDVFKRVRTEVRSKSGGTQVPEERSSLEGDFYFARVSMVVVASPVPPAVREPVTKLESDSDNEAILSQKEALARERQELERQKALDAEREQLAAERRKIEAEKQQLAMGPRPTVTGPREISRDGRFIAYDNGTVLDTKTNLMWAAKDNGSNINWANAKSYCENYRGGGYTDWRMPTPGELAGLYDSNKKNRRGAYVSDLIDIPICWVWASATRGSDASLFYFDTGRLDWDGKFIYKQCRALPVRSVKKEALEREARERQDFERQKTLDAEREQLATERRKIEAEKQQVAMGPRPTVTGPREISRDGRFTAYDNGTVLDTKTNLMWATKDNGSDINWANAKSYCENYRGGGYLDWRMPTGDELAALYNKNKFRPATCAPHDNNHLETKLIDISCFWVWVSEKRSFLVWTDAAAFSFFSGLQDWYNPNHIVYYRALPVRSVK